MDLRALPTRITISGLPALAAALMLCTTAQAASNAIIPCEQVGRDLQSLDVPVNEFAIDGVDHAPIEPEIVEADARATEPVAPILNLGSRLSSIVRDVFDATTDDVPQEDAEQQSVSPVADRVEKKDSSEAADSAGQKSTMPRFQRQMLRTDI